MVSEASNWVGGKDYGDDSASVSHRITPVLKERIHEYDSFTMAVFDS